MSVREWGLGRPEAAVPDPSCKLFPKIWLYRKCPETRNENAKRLCCELHSRSVTPLEGQDSQARGDSALCLTASSRLEGTQTRGSLPSENSWLTSRELGAPCTRQARDLLSSWAQGRPASPVGPPSMSKQEPGWPSGPGLPKEGAAETVG